MKTKRIINKPLTDSYKGRPCENCNSSYLSSGHHIKHKGSGGPDIEWNLIALCWPCHEEIHRSKLKFCQKYPNVMNILKEKGWEYNAIFNKWYNEKNYIRTATQLSYTLSHDK